MVHVIGFRLAISVGEESISLANGIFLQPLHHILLVLHY